MADNDGELNSNDQKRFSQLLRNTPIDALPGYGMVAATLHPKSTDELYSTFVYVVEALKRQYSDVEKMRDQAAATELDFRAAGRIFARLGIAVPAAASAGTDDDNR